MRIEQFAYVVAVAEEMSFSRAAKRLHVTQPSLSQSISTIEQRFGVKLFHRTTNEISLTYEGEQFLDTAQQILALCSSYTAKISDVNELKRGHITVGVPNFRGCIILSRVLPHFMNEFPQIEVSVIEADSSRLEELTSKGRTDVTIINLPIKQKDISYEPICTERLLLAMPPNHPICQEHNISFSQNFNDLPQISLKDVSKEPFVLLKEEHRLGQSARLLFKYSNITPNIRLEVNNLLTAQQLVAAGLGLSFFGETAAKFSKLVPCPVYFRLDDSSIQWTLVAAYKSNRYISKASKEFIRITKEELG